MAGDIEAVISSHIEETVKELTQSEGVEASVAGITPERATTEIGEPSILPEEEATPKAGEEPTLQGEEVTIEARGDFHSAGFAQGFDISGPPRW